MQVQILPFPQVTGLITGRSVRQHIQGGGKQKRMGLLLYLWAALFFCLHNGYKYETEGIKCETLSADQK